MPPAMMAPDPNKVYKIKSNLWHSSWNTQQSLLRRRAASRRWQISSCGEWAFEKLRNTISLVHPLCRAGAETVIFIRHRELISLSFQVLHLLRPPARFLRSQVPVSRISHARPN